MTYFVWALAGKFIHDAIKLEDSNPNLNFTFGTTRRDNTYVVPAIGPVVR